MRRCFLLLVDGLRADVAETELHAGRLPALARLVASGGASRAVTSFPSTTSVSYLPFLTGCTPGRCNVPSIRWLDRERYDGRWWASRDAVRSYCGWQAGHLDRDIAPDVHTLFELVPESVGIFTMITRGLPAERDPGRSERKLWGALAHYAEWHQPSDEAVAGHLLRAVESDARFVFAQFPAVDGYSHQHRPDAPRVLRALHRVDGVVGRLLDRLAARRELDEALVVLVSDHGASEVHTHLDLADWFRERGVRTLAHPVLWTRRPGAAVMVAGNGSAMVYARPDVPRAGRWPMARLREHDAFGAGRDLVAALAAEPAVGLLAAETGSAGELAVLRGAAEARLRRDGRHLDYRPLNGGEDPLELGGAFRATHREWLERTWDSRFPDAAYQLLDQFASPRTGDLLVVANEGYDFRRRFEIPEHRSGHGSLIRAHMHTPLWSNRQPPRATLRTVDLFPALLEWLGVPVPANIDGEPVWSFRSAGNGTGTPAAARSPLGDREAGRLAERRPDRVLDEPRGPVEERPLSVR